MFGSKRNQYEIIKEILELCRYKGISKTKIVYNCNLNFTIVKKYLRILLEYKVLKKEEDYYITTDKGIILLNNLSSISNQLINTFKNNYKLIPI